VTWNLEGVELAQHGVKPNKHDCALCAVRNGCYKTLAIPSLRLENQI